MHIPANNRENNDCRVQVKPNNYVLGYGGGDKIWITLSMTRELVEKNVVVFLGRLFDYEIKDNRIQGGRFVAAQDMHKEVKPEGAKKSSREATAGRSSASRSSTVQRGQEQQSASSQADRASTTNNSQQSGVRKRRDSYGPLRSTTRT